MAKSEGECSVLTLSLLAEQLSMYGVHLYELADRVNTNHKRMLYLQRKKAAIRKQQHDELANEILQVGNEIYVETMEHQPLQKRAKSIYGESAVDGSETVFCSMCERIFQSE